MKTLVFSDTHLSGVFDPLQFNHLIKIISKADRVIINGDFWNRCLYTFDQFVNSSGNCCFPCSKPVIQSTSLATTTDKNGLIKESINSLFASARVFVLRMGPSNSVTHGDAIIPLYEDYILGRSLRFLCSRTWIRLEAIGIRLVGKRFSRVGAATNATLKTFAKQRLDEDEILVCGHSHLPEYDLDNNFINLGLHRQGLGQYLMVDDHTVELLEETYY